VESITTLAEKIREHYLDCYVTSLKEFQSMHSPSAPEVLFELQRECAYPFRLYRADMASNAGGKSKMQEVNPASHLSFEPFTVTVSPNLEVKLHPIAWNGVDFRINASPSWTSLEAWALRWLDVEDKHEQDANGLQGVIHSVTAPKAGGGQSEFSVDFGSAPILAMQELLNVLSDLGATVVEVKSSCLV